MATGQRMGSSGFEGMGDSAARCVPLRDLVWLEVSLDGECKDGSGPVEGGLCYQLVLGG